MPPTAKTKTARTRTATKTPTAGQTTAVTTGTTGGTTAGSGRPGRGPGAVGYRQVADALREQITAGALPPAAPVPSEAQLMAAYGVSRPTVRAAVAALVSEGLVVTLHGKGSFVRRADDRPSLTHTRAITATTTPAAGTVRRSAGRPRKPARPAVAFHDAQLDDPRWRPVDPPATYRTTAGPDLALALGLPEQAPVFVADRLLSDPAGRRQSHRLYVPFAVAADIPALEDDPFRGPGDLYAVLTATGNELDWTETVRARMPAPDDAAALRIPTGTPMLIVRRTTRTTTGRILALEETRLSAEDTQLAYRLPAPLTG